jgi:hypothetical protein
LEVEREASETELEVGRETEATIQQRKAAR